MLLSLLAKLCFVSELLEMRCNHLFFCPSSQVVYQVHKELQDTMAQLEAIRHEIQTISFMNPGPLTSRLVDSINTTTANSAGISLFLTDMIDYRLFFTSFSFVLLLTVENGPRKSDEESIIVEKGPQISEKERTVATVTPEVLWFP